MTDPRETQHVRCDCVPGLGPAHCHLCGDRAGHVVPWDECTCHQVENPWTYYGIVEPGGALEPNPECPLHYLHDPEERTS